MIACIPDWAVLLGILTIGAVVVICIDLGRPETRDEAAAQGGEGQHGPADGRSHGAQGGPS